MASFPLIHRRRWRTGVALGAIYLLPFLTVIGATDIFLKVGDIKGESIDEQYRSWSEAESHTFGVSRSIQGDPRADRLPSRPVVSDFHVAKPVDSASPLLFREAAVGDAKTVELDFIRTINLERQRFYKVKLYEALVVSMSLSSGGESGYEHVVFNSTKMEMTYTDFSKGAMSSTVWYDIAAGTVGDNAPTISSIGATATAEDTAVTVSFTVGDAETPAGSLTVSAQSSNPVVAPVSNIIFGGSGASRTAQIAPGLNQSGSSTITIRVSDGSMVATSAFVLTVSAVNDAPTILAISSKVTDANTALTVPFQISDVDNSTDSLILSAQSSNQSLVPNANVVFSGSGINRTATITPAPDQLGETTITLIVADGSLTNSRSFLLTVQEHTPQSPSDILLSNGSIPENSPAGTLIGNFVAIDSDSTNHIFTLTDSAGGRFRIEGNQLLVDTASLIDFETGTIHEILVKATDPDGLQFGKTLFVRVLNVNETPAFVVADNSVIVTIAGRDTEIARLQITDPDAGTNSISLHLRVINGILNVSSNFMGSVTNNGTGALTLFGSLSNLNTILSGSNGLIYRATTNASGTDLFTVTVEDNGHSGSGTNHTVYTTLGIQFYRSQYEQWLVGVFSEGERNDLTLRDTLWGVNADPDKDGLANLTEYALGTSPRQANPKPAAGLVTKGDSDYLSLQMNCRRDPDLLLSVQVAGDVDAASWSAEATDLETFAPVDLLTGFDRVRFDDRTASSETSRRFMRMRWTLQNAP